MNNTMRLLLLLRRRGAVYLLRDDFNTDAAAPLASPRTAEPGPGTLTLVQTDGQFSVSGGKLVNTAQATPNWGDLGLYGAGFARTIGRAVLGTMSSTDTAKNGPIFGWKPTANAGNDNDSESVYFRGAASGIRVYRIGIEIDIFPFVANTDYQFAVVMRSVGTFIFVKGGVFATWTLLWVGNAGSTATLYPQFTTFDAVNTLDSFRVVDLPAPFNTDYGLATQRLAGARTAGDAFTHTADCLIEFVATALPTTGSDMRVTFRRQDVNNYWEVLINKLGEFYLLEYVAGTPTTRASAAGAVAAGNRVVIVADGATIRGYSNNALRWTYSSASNFATATAGTVKQIDAAGSLSDLISWPRTVTLPYGL